MQVAIVVFVLIGMVVPSPSSLDRPVSASAIRLTAGGIPRATSARRLEMAASVALTALAVLPRVSSLSRSLFTDEACSLASSQRSFGHLVALFGSASSEGTPIRPACGR